MTVDKKKAAELLWGIYLELNEAITNCEDKELQSDLIWIDGQLDSLCEAMDIQPSNGKLRLLVQKDK